MRTQRIKQIKCVDKYIQVVWRCKWSLYVTAMREIREMVCLATLILKLNQG